VLAAQIRGQGFACDEPQKATRDAKLSKPDYDVWVLTKDRGRYDRSKLRYPSDLTDDEWAHIETLIPPAKRGGNRRDVNNETGSCM
jgi:hypothetical protein